MSIHSYKVTGTDIWYYFICPRELWLMMHRIAPEQEDENIDIGRFLHEYYSKRGKEEVDIGSGKIDRLKKKNGKWIVQEIKKTGRFRESSRYQLLYYLSQLEEMGIYATGELLFTEEKTRETVVLTDDERHKLQDVIEDIRRIGELSVPPSPKKIKYCWKCAYREYCWAGE